MTVREQTLIKWTLYKAARDEGSYPLIFPYWAAAIRKSQTWRLQNIHLRRLRETLTYFFLTRHSVSGFM
jgi:hypothetical protein